MLPSAGFGTIVLAFLLLLGPLVVLHELGHYLVGRWFGVKAEAFSIGFGKELAGWTDQRGTRWKLSAMPFGGYVRFAGDADATSRPGGAAGLSSDERARTLEGRPVWQRALIVFAGPLTNALLAVAIFSGLIFVYGRLEAPPVVAAVAAGSPAAQAGVRVGDRILAIDGDRIDSFTEVAGHVIAYPGDSVTLAVRRGEATLALRVRIAAVVERDGLGNQSTIGRIGVAGGRPQRVPVGPVAAVQAGFYQAVDIARMIGAGLGQLVTGERSVREMGGPVSIARVSGGVLSLGWVEFIAFAGFYSLNLAFINLLPIPGLDGGHLVFYAAEAVRRRPLAQRSQEWAFRTGIAFVLALMVFVTLNDLIKLLPGAGE